MNLSAFLSEIRRRKVFRTAGLYAVCAAGVWGAAEIAVEALGLSPAIMTFVVVTSIIGFPFALVLSWFYQITPEGGVADGPGASSSPPISKAIAVGLITAIVGFVGLTASVAMQGGAESAGPDPSVAFERTQLTFLGSAQSPAFSPDGRYIAFHATFGDQGETIFSDSLMVMVPGETESRALANVSFTPPGERLPRILWSADGAEVWYRALDTTLVDEFAWALRGVPLEGGASRPVWSNWFSGTAGPKDDLVLPFSDGRPGVQIHNLVTGESRETVIDQPRWYPYHLDVSASGDRVAAVLLNQAADSSALWSISLDDAGESHRLDIWASGGVGGGAQWAREGRSIYYDRDGRLWRVDVEPATGNALVEGGTFTGHDLPGLFTVSPDGRRIVMEQRQGGSNLWLLPVSEDTLQGPGRQLTRGVFFRSGTLSPDGSRVAVATYEDEGLTRSRGASIVDLTGGSEHVLTSTPAWDLRWSPDGSELAFIGEQEGVLRVFVINADGTNQRLVGTSEVIRPMGLSWCSTGEVLYPTPQAHGLVVLDPQTGHERMLLPEDDKTVTFFPRCSPDGTEAAVVAMDATGVGLPMGVYAMTLASGALRPLAVGYQAFPFGWPQGEWIYAGDGRIPVGGGAGVGFEHVGGAQRGVFQSVDPRGDVILLAVPEATASDLYLIEYAASGGN